MQFEIPCPSGAVFLFKEMGGEQIIAVAERVGANTSSETLTTVLAGCCTEILDPGPYPALEVGKGSPNWANLLYGDVITALLWLRVKSFPEVGASYEYDFTCEHCKHVCGATHDLVGLLEDPDANRMLSDESTVALLANQPLTAKIPARYAPKLPGVESSVGELLTPEISITYDLHRITQDTVMKVQMKRQDRKKVTTIEQVATQLKSVAGLVTAKNNEPVRDLPGLWKWARQQSADTIDNLLSQMRDADCGVDPVVMAWCDQPDCGKEQRISLPFGRSFFNPRLGATKKALTRKAASSASSSPA